MIFKPELAKLIIQRKKTQTRRTITDRSLAHPYLAQKSYAVCPGRGKRAMCRITMTEVRQERLGDLSLKDAKREGFVTTQEFFDYWTQLYGSVDHDQTVWVLSFTLGDLTDTLHLLAARPGAPHGDYVTVPHLAMGGSADPGEAVTPAEAERFAKVAGARDEKIRKDTIRQSRDTIAGEVKRLRGHLATASGADRDVQSAVRVAERGLATADRGLRALERKLDPESQLEVPTSEAV
jgi:hypothetical protein